MHTPSDDWFNFSLMIDGRSAYNGQRCGFSSGGWHSKSRRIVFQAEFSEKCRFDHVELKSTVNRTEFITYLPDEHPARINTDWQVDLRGSASTTYLTLWATPNRPVNESGPIYAIFIDDLTTGERLNACTGSGLCRKQIRKPSARHVYVATIASIHDSRQFVQATSSFVEAGPEGDGDGGPILAREVVGGGNPSEPCATRCHGDPINTATGEFFENAVDLMVPGVGPALSWSRSFASSLAGEEGSLGYGWSHAYDMRLVPRDGSPLASADTLDVVQENGSVAVFSRIADGSYTAAPRVLATLERESTGFRFVRAGKTAFLFDQAGRLQRVEDPNGEGLTVEYDSTGRLQRVTDDDGRSLALTWSGTRMVGVASSAGGSVTYTYSTRGDLTQVTFPDGSSRSYEYDLDHRVITLTDGAGDSTTNTYDEQGRVARQTDPLGRSWSFRYDPEVTEVTAPDGSVTLERYVDRQLRAVTYGAGTDDEATTQFAYGPTNQPIAILDAAGRLTRFTYDGRGNRTSVTDSLGRVSTTTYDQWNNALEVTNPAAQTTTYAYDQNGNLLSATDPTGAVTAFTVNPDGTVATSTDPLGRVTSYAYDAHGFVSSVTGPDGAVVTAVHDALGRLVASTDARGSVPVASPLAYTTTFSYDAAGRLLSTTDPLGGVVASMYDATGRLTSVTDPLGAVTAREYDAAGQLVAVSDVLGNRAEMTYDGAGRVLTLTDAIGAVTSTEYDALGRPVAVTDATGATARTEYDAADQVVATVSPSGARTTYTYDAAGQRVSVTDPLGGVTATTYDTAGRPVTVTDADGRVVSTSYDAAGRPTSVQRDDGSVVSWAYDAAGQLVSYTDAAGAVTTYTYDVAGRRATSTDPAGRTTTSAYDPAGMLATVTLPDGEHVDYSHDPAGRLAGVDYSDATADLTYSYDLAGRVTGVVDGTGPTATTYDAAGRPAQISSAAGTVGYEWDAVGRLVELTYPTGQAVQRSYDAVGRLSTLTDWTGRAFAYDWTPDGELAQVTYPNGVVTDYTYDDAGQVATVGTTDAAGGALSDLGYAYTPAGLLATQTTDRSAQPRAPPALPTSASSFDWDPLGRIGRVTGDQAGEFTFDGAGSPTVLADGRTLTYDNARQATNLTVPGVGTDPDTVTAFAYDGRGNRASATTPDLAGLPRTVEHVYDLADRLTVLTAPDDSTTSYAYDAAGLRASATTSDGTTTEVEPYMWDTVAAVPVLLTDGQFAYLYGPDDVPVAQVDLTNGAVDYLHTDLIGSVRTTTDHTGVVTGDTDYTPYGTPVGVSPDTVDQVTRFGFTGQYTDPGGYVYLRARYYDPATAQFLTIDPLVNTTHDPYGYTPGNPLQFVDPLGLDWLQDAGDWAAAFGDTLTFGGTRWARQQFGVDDAVNYCSTFYTWGGVGGTVASLAPVGGGAIKAGGAAMNRLNNALNLSRATPAATIGRAASAPPKALTASSRVAPWAGPSLSRLSSEGEVMYRVYGGGASKAGSWLSPINPASSAAARQGLALPGENAALYVSKVALPGGVRVQVGTAGSAFGQPGGWAQAQLLERIPLSSFGKGVPLQ